MLRVNSRFEMLTFKKMYTKFCGLCPNFKSMRSYGREEPFVAVGHDEIFSHDVSIVCGGLKELTEVFTLTMKEGKVSKVSKLS